LSAVVEDRITVAGAINQKCPICKNKTEMHGFPLGVSLGLLCDSRTQDWGTTRFISKEIREQKMRRRNRKKKDVCIIRQYNGLNL
jgi:hypothetical protein